MVPRVSGIVHRMAQYSPFGRPVLAAASSHSPASVTGNRLAVANTSRSRDLVGRPQISAHKVPQFVNFIEKTAPPLVKYLEMAG